MLFGHMTSDDGTRTLVSLNPGRDVQRVGTANFLGEDVEKIHDPVWAVLGNLGDSQCYLGVTAKVQAVQAALHRRIAEDRLGFRLIAPAFTLGVSDGQLNGTPQMRFSLIGRELVHDVADVHLAANGVAGLIAVVACDKPPVGTLAAILENDTPAVILSDGSIHPGIDPATGPPIDLVSAFQMADQPEDVRTRYALHACPGQGSCGGMFTYNTMQTFIAVLGLEPLHMVSPASDDPRRLGDFPDQMVDCLLTMTEKGIRPSDIVTPASLRNAVTVAIAMGGSTNVVLHSVEIARAAGIDFWAEAHEPAGVQRAGPPAARPRQYEALRRVLHGRRGRERRAPGDRQGASGRRLPRRVRHDLYGRDPGRTGGAAGAACARPRGHLQRREAVQGHRRAAPVAGQPGARGRRHPEGGRCRGRRDRRRLHRAGAGLQRRTRPHRRARTITPTPSATTTWW